MYRLKKWFSLVELLAVMVLIAIIGVIANNVFIWYLAKWKDEKRLNATKSYALAVQEIIGRAWDIPTWYCTNDGGATYNSSCFSDNWCTTQIFCWATNRNCSLVWQTYYDFNKLLNDYSYKLPADIKIVWENMPKGMNFKLCPSTATISAYANVPLPKESWFTGVDPNVQNPSFYFKFLDYDGNNRLLLKSGSDF